MKLIFLVALVYLLIEFLNRKPKDTTDKTSFDKAIDKAADTLEEVVEKTKDALRTPSEKSVVDVQSLDTALTKTPEEKAVIKELVEEGEITPESLYSSRHEATPDYEKAAKEVVTRNEKVAREAINAENSVDDEVTDKPVLEVDDLET